MHDLSTNRVTEIPGAEIFIDFVPEATKNYGTIYYMTEKVLLTGLENIEMASIKHDI